ncbi:MAG: class I SAM-dependent methyltransferase [Rhodothermales bacterium]|nr:class I SAM-dependent methyltransferase [Rhodothermales bacterium]
MYESREPSDSLGTGRIYLGREIPHVREHAEVAQWLDRPERDIAEFPDRLLSALELKPADVVADIGAGTGFYTFRIASLVPHGRVLAVDIQPAMLQELRLRATENGVRNIDVIEGAEDDPRLPPNSVDLALIVGSYHEFYHPYEMMVKIVEALVPGGKVALVEYRGEDDTLPLPAIHRLSEEQARKEMEFVGLKWAATKRELPQQHLLIFEKPVP